MSKNQTEKIFASVPCSINITKEQLDNILSTAIEGGSTYWADFRPGVFPEGKTKESYQFWRMDVIFDGGSLKICDAEALSDDESDQGFEPVLLDLDMLLKALPVFAEKYPKHFLEWALDEDYDATNADLFLQTACFGEETFS